MIIPHPVCDNAGRFQKMLKNENIICISSIDWDFVWQGHQEIMSTLAKNGNRVIFIENTGVRMPGLRDLSRIKNRIKNWLSGVGGIRKKDENLYVFSPFILPFPYSRFARLINKLFIMSVLRKWIKIMLFDSSIIWVFLPTPLTLDIIDNLSSKLVIYYCIDNFRVSSVSAKKIKKSEIKIIKKSDLIFVTSNGLHDYCVKYNKSVHIFPFAVNFSEFEKVRLQNCPIPIEMEVIKKPIIGFVGGVHKWIDFNLIKIAAERYPQYSFVFIGPLQSDISLLAKLQNVYFLGKVEHVKLPYFIKNFDIGLIPYLVTDYTRNVYPTKLNEYLSMGKPVVSTNLPEIANFNRKNGNLVLIGKNEEEFIRQISFSLEHTDEGSIDKMISIAKKNSWDSRIEVMCNIIDEEIGKKTKAPRDWQEAFLKIYKTAREKIVTICSVSLCAYLFVFYTPIVWLLAKPLEISQLPEKADCIVVFAGGVGESGERGQGYEERVEYAVELYKKGYATYILFSSGYSYVFNEPIIMKALAVSLGVPEGAVVLENNAHRTYENVKLSKEILNKKNWNKILLISSPYHMRRVSLVFNKIAKTTKVIYTPVPNSLFYAHPERDANGKKIWKRINIEQIKGIVHEYLGIIYSLWKGWI
jgi:uncharacterized SAM-binding protein YcdF (DUF218 family)/glycosyltransferase involved in cell wall biosynthesis